MDRKVLNPIIDDFVKNLEEVEDKKKLELKTLEEESQKARDLQDDLKKQIKDNENKAESDKRKIADKEEGIARLKDDLNKEITDTNNLNQRTQDELRKIEKEKKSQEEMSRAKSAELALQRTLI